MSIDFQLSLTVTMKAAGKMDSKSINDLVKSWGLKSPIRALRRSLTFASADLAVMKSDTRSINSPDSLLRLRAITSKSDVWRALSPSELPEAALYPLHSTRELNNDLFASLTGPNSGLSMVQKWSKLKQKNLGSPQLVLIG